jgi:zinc transporter ZupT
MLAILLISIGTFCATLIGGMIALRFKDRLHLILGFSAGAVIAVALFDLLPEALDLGEKFYSSSTLTTIVGVGFLAYLILDRVVQLHTHADDDEDSEQGQTRPGAPQRGILGASTLSLHSFLDGVAIGLAFQISTAVGAIVAVAVLVHDFSDGVNTVNLIIKNKGEKKGAYKWLVIDALAPVVGVVATFFFSLPEQSLSIVLSLFAGFFLYVGASDLIPESHHAHPKFFTTFTTILGAGVLYAAIKLAGM